MLHRLFDDYYFHGFIRPGMKAEIKKKGWNPLKLTRKQLSILEEEGLLKLEIFAKGTQETYAPSWSAGSITDFSFRLPWGRLFEAEIDFRLGKK